MTPSLIYSNLSLKRSRLFIPAYPILTWYNLGASMLKRAARHIIPTSKYNTATLPGRFYITTSQLPLQNRVGNQTIIKNATKKYPITATPKNRIPHSATPSLSSLFFRPNGFKSENISTKILQHALTSTRVMVAEAKALLIWWWIGKEFREERKNSCQMSRRDDIAVAARMGVIHFSVSSFVIPSPCGGGLPKIIHLIATKKLVAGGDRFMRLFSMPGVLEFIW